MRNEGNIFEERRDAISFFWSCYDSEEQLIR